MTKVKLHPEVIKFFKEHAVYNHHPEVGITLQTCTVVKDPSDDAHVDIYPPSHLRKSILELIFSRLASRLSEQYCEQHITMSCDLWLFLGLNEEGKDLFGFKVTPLYELGMFAVGKSSKGEVKIYVKDL